MQPLRQAALAGALALALAGCSPGAGIPGSGSTVPAGSGTTPRPAGGPVVVGLGGLASPRTLNPLLDGPDTGVLDAVGRGVFAAAFSLDPITREPIPEVLFEVPTVAGRGVVVRPDGSQEVTYRVSPAARWSDGVAVTAEDLRFTYEVATDAALPIRRDVRAQYAAVAPGSVSADGLTLRLTLLPGGDPAMLFGLIVPAHQVAGSDFVHDWNDRMWAAAGPLAFVGWEPGHYLRLRRNPYYAAVAAETPAGAPVDDVVYRFFPEADGVALAEAFAARLVDVAIVRPGVEASGYEAPAGEGAVVQSVPGSDWLALLFQFGPANRNTASLNAERRFREAVARAVDREEVGRAVGGSALGSIYTSGPVTLAGTAWDGLDSDPARASDLLDELGRDLGMNLSAGNGPRLLLVVAASDPAAVRAGEVVGGMLRRAGIAAEVQVEEPEQFYGESLPEGTWDTAVVTLSSNPGLGGARALAGFFNGSSSPRGATDPGGWGRDRATAAGYAAVIDHLEVAGDAVTTVRLLRRAEEILAGQVVLVPLATAGLVTLAYWPDRVAGIRPDAAGRIAVNPAEWSRPS